jgi:branched-chain amino acid transport system substrate-binding protein
LARFFQIRDRRIAKNLDANCMGLSQQTKNMRRGAKMRNLHSIVCAGILAFVMTICFMPVRNVLAAETIKFGFIGDATGTGAELYRGQKLGLDWIFEEVNASGGVLGKKIELIVRDAKLKPDLGASLARELVLDQKVDFLLGGISSAVCLAVSNVAKEFKKPYMIQSTNTSALVENEFHHYVAQGQPNTNMLGRGLAYFVAKSNFKSTAYIGNDYTFGHTLWDSYSSYLKKHAPQVEQKKTFWAKQAEDDFTSFIQPLMAQNADIVYCTLWGGQLPTFIKQATPYGFFKKTKMATLFDLVVLMGAGKDMPEGLLGYSVAPFYAIQTKEMKAFNEKYYKKYQEWPMDYVILCYDDVKAMIEAIKKAGSTDPDKVMKALEGLHYVGLRGPMYFRPEDHLANAGLYMGYTASDPKYPFRILKNVTYVPGEQFWTPVEELKSIQPK